LPFLVPSPDGLLPGRFRGAVFDFDGLLVDSEPEWARAEAILLDRHGSVFTEADRVATVGRSPEQTIRAYGARLGLAPDDYPALRRELLELVGDRFRRGLQPRPGAVELVRWLGSIMPLALASNTDRWLVQAGLAASAFAAAFRVVLTADDVKNHKPAPDLYLLACRRLGLATSDAIAFEDSLAGVASARAAGLTVVAVPERRTKAFDVADLVLDSLEELLPSDRRRTEGHNVRGATR
jgi:HAD superfamily hydrolase (TIGR01509 family)